jgi:hypothetical protein
MRFQSGEIGMSETTTRPEQTRARAQAARAAMREATQNAEEAVQAAAEGTNEFIGNVADTVARSADAAVDISQRVADQSREVIWLGMRAAAGMNGRLADAGYGTGQRALEQTARIWDIYGQASERTMEKLQAMFAAGLTLGRGAQLLQHTWLNLMDRSMNEAVRKPQDLLRAKTLSEFADTQRELYVGAVNQAVEASSTMLRAAERMARDALSTLENRPRAAE